MSEVVMSAVASPNNPRLLPGLRYRDVAGAIDWLCGAFGFTKHDVVTAVDGTILHARLAFGTEMILLLPVRNPGSNAARPVQEIGNEMQSCYFAVDDADAHYKNAKRAGAEILEITEYEYGGRGYPAAIRRAISGTLSRTKRHRRRTGRSRIAAPSPPKTAFDRRKFVDDLRLRTIAGVKHVGGKVSRRMVVAAAASVAVVTVATAGWMLVPPWQSAPEEKSQKLKASLPPRAGENAGQQAMERLRLNRKVLARIHRKEPAPESTTPQQAAESGGASSPVFGATTAAQQSDRNELTERKELNGGLALQSPPAPQVPQDTPRQPRAAEKAPAERVLIPTPVRVETPKPPPKASPEVREQQSARERAAKEYAERAKGNVERAKGNAAPAVDINLPEAHSPLWDCQTGPGGSVSCNPKQGPTEANPAPGAPKPKVTAAQPPSAAPAAPSVRQPPASSQQLWDCQPQPPAGEMVCRPIGGARP